MSIGWHAGDSGGRWLQIKTDQGISTSAVIADYGVVILRFANGTCCSVRVGWIFRTVNSVL